MKDKIKGVSDFLNENFSKNGTIFLSELKKLLVLNNVTDAENIANKIYYSYSGLEKPIWTIGILKEIHNSEKKDDENN